MTMGTQFLYYSSTILEVKLQALTINIKDKSQMLCYMWDISFLLSESVHCCINET